MTTQPETRLLKDWNPQDGDVFKIISYDKASWLVGNVYTYRYGSFGVRLYRDNERHIDGQNCSLALVSRATPHPRTFGELTDAEKGALLLAHHEGKRIEWKCPIGYGGGDMWRHCPRSVGKYSDYIYRIAPTRITGTCETDADGKPLFDTWEASDDKANV